jgi:uncharacterized protein YecE (DUF72 family)
MGAWPIRIGCAGWGLPSAKAGAFPSPGTHLERYVRVLPAVEVNSSFYRPHRRETWERWAASVPPGFRFSVKVPRQITHFRRLREADPALDELLGQVSGLGPKLGPLLVQLPPSFAFDDPAAARPGGWRGLTCWRLHGSSRMYVSAYSRAFLRRLAATLTAGARRAETWCVFDNTADGAALDDARALLALCAPEEP